MSEQEWIVMFREKMDALCKGKKNWKKIAHVFSCMGVEDPKEVPDVTFSYRGRVCDLSKERQREFNKNIYNILMAYDLIPGLRRVFRKELETNHKTEEGFGGSAGISEVLCPGFAG